MMATKWVCAWCTTEFGIIDVNPPDQDEISHGICPACYDNQIRELYTHRNMTNEFNS
jgi:hypothetical protein